MHHRQIYRLNKQTSCLFPLIHHGQSKLMTTSGRTSSFMYGAKQSYNPVSFDTNPPLCFFLSTRSPFPSKRYSVNVIWTVLTLSHFTLTPALSLCHCAGHCLFILSHPPIHPLGLYPLMQRSPSSFITLYLPPLPLPPWTQQTQSTSIPPCPQLPQTLLPQGTPLCGLQSAFWCHRGDLEAIHLTSSHPHPPPPPIPREAQNCIIIIWNLFSLVFLILS